jgi:hypothetical protein
MLIVSDVKPLLSVRQNKASEQLYLAATFRPLAGRSIQLFCSLLSKRSRNQLFHFTFPELLPFLEEKKSVCLILFLSSRTI